MTRERSPVPFDAGYFRKKAEKGERFTTAEAFAHIYETNHWAGKDSVSGEGSDLVQTAAVRQELANILKEFNVSVFLDLPCGDFGWMSSLELPVDAYIGGDIVEDLVRRNRELYGNERRKFMVLDITGDTLPAADLLFCRDCLVHFSFEDTGKALRTVRGSTIRHILTTTFPECEKNDYIVTGDWRVINLERPPFNFPKPLRLINERCTEGGGTYADKSLGLWEVRSLPA
ncbi:MAG TPA: class I SAM-dependent methyltransferase [Spirochaetota bacterium]|nr:class I SAM-dependent methyltransferase [Spirochaetota bacterium]HPC40572.1 class I SAM-dependent methyltransferase [Spirochaetota bacterium]HPL18397.1 class I SAM-dependent methyltransferase [Spirochaetota bacterium]HQF07920.1 class I SAM-dependent methyltransferase [Spirochaetota bacterium]HQH96480.1 class I SAM-dependent methyltransferase [Spirochaetota bacterium]